MSNDVCCSEVAYPLESNLAKFYKPKPKDLTDTEKAIYLKLVELAKAGKIAWDARNAGCYGLYRVSIYDNTIQVIKTDGELRRVWDVATFDIAGMQVAGDLATIASDQYDKACAQHSEEFLSA